MLSLRYNFNGKKGKTVTPSRKLQAKDKISSLYDSRLSTSTLRNIPSDEERGETVVCAG